MNVSMYIQKIHIYILNMFLTKIILHACTFELCRSTLKRNREIYFIIKRLNFIVMQLSL